MKRNYIKPSQRTVALGTEESMLITGSGQLGQQVPEGGNAVKQFTSWWDNSNDKSPITDTDEDW